MTNSNPWDTVTQTSTTSTSTTTRSIDMRPVAILDRDAALAAVAEAAAAGLIKHDSTPGGTSKV